MRSTRFAHSLGLATMAALTVTSGSRGEAIAAKKPQLEVTAERDMGKPLKLSQRALAEIGPVYTEPGEIPQLQIEQDGKKLDLPLEHTHVKAQITGFVARVEVTQTYKNPFDDPLEAIYVFPLPENSAVDDMRIKIGDRVIVAEIKKRKEARETYEQAKRDGHTAALLEQERPNIFTQSVANIEPGKNIDVVVSYLQTLTYDAGKYEFVFPMVVGPRFMPGEALDRPSQGSGWAADTTRVPDASRISPPILGGGMRSGHDISLELVANAGLPIRGWDAPTHDVEETATFDGTLKLKLIDADNIPNRDFVLRYEVDGELPQATLLSHANGQEGGFFSLVIQPPSVDMEELVGQRELIFVLDVSGSMHGVPLQMGKDAMRHALRQLRPVDTFNVITFAGRTGTAFSAPRPANQTNLRQAMQFVDGLEAGGGTHMLQGVQAALSPTIEPGRHRYVFFMTDGYIGNEREIYAGTQQLIAALEERGQRARVFGYGLGSSVNRALLDAIGKHGKGTTVYSSTREDPTVPVNTFFRYIDHPILTDLDIDWGGLKVKQVFPTVTPDLFASRPTVIHGRYEGSGKGTIRIRGIADGRAQTMKLAVNLPRREKEHAALATLWARSKIEDLERSMVNNGGHQQAVDAITKLGIDFRIVTAYTSFVAVDKTRTVDGTLKTVVQPVEAPEGVDPSMAAPPQARYRSARRGKLESRAMVLSPLSSAPAGRGGVASGEAYGVGGLGTKSGYGRAQKKPAPTPRVDEESDDSAKVDRDAHASLRHALGKRLNEVLANLPPSAHGPKTVKLRVKLTLSRTGAVLQPKLLAGREQLGPEQQALILRELHRFRASNVRTSRDMTLELTLTLSLL